MSVSTGVLGLREPLGPNGKPTGEIGMTCWLCHGEANPIGGAIVLGLPGAAFDYGLLLATAAVLDDGNAAAVADRQARGFPSGRTVRARLLLAGPGRQDLTGEFGLDVTVPGYHSARYLGTARVRQRTRGLVNPISVPTILAAPGLALENWSGPRPPTRPGSSACSRSAVRRRCRGGGDDGSRGRPARAPLRPAQSGNAGVAAGFVPRAALVRRNLRTRHAVADGARRHPQDVRRDVGARRAGRQVRAAAGRRRGDRPRARIFSERVIGAIANRRS